VGLTGLKGVRVLLSSLVDILSHQVWNWQINSSTST